MIYERGDYVDEKIKITLAAARVNANLTQIEASKALNISKSTLINWEKGKTSPKIIDLKKMSILYNIPIDYIFLS